MPVRGAIRMESVSVLTRCKMRARRVAFTAGQSAAPPRAARRRVRTARGGAALCPRRAELCRALRPQGLVLHVQRIRDCLVRHPTPDQIDAFAETGVLRS